MYYKCLCSTDTREAHVVFLLCLQSHRGTVFLCQSSWGGMGITSCKSEGPLMFRDFKFSQATQENCWIEFTSKEVWSSGQIQLVICVCCMLLNECFGLIKSQVEQTIWREAQAYEFSCHCQLQIENHHSISKIQKSSFLLN